MKELVLPRKIRLLADSICWTDSRLTSFLIPLPTCLLAELRTHRILKWGEDGDFSVNANSDRAIPIEKKIQSVIDHPYIPIVSLANKGMTAIEEVDEDKERVLTAIWVQAKDQAIKAAKLGVQEGGSKQYINRMLAPYSWSEVVVTADNRGWSHFFKLRTDSTVEPNFRYIVNEMKKIYDNSSPKYLQEGDWHISFSEEAEFCSDISDKLIVSASCCARISYDIEREENFEKHLDRFNKCVFSDPPHASVAEHQARVPNFKEGIDRKYDSNIYGWTLFRKVIENKEFEYAKH